MIDLTLFSKLNFSYPFRKYQNLILAYVESHQDDSKIHIVAPPGSGKTIVGLELIRRFGLPAVIFSPTSTIQSQWIDKVSLFLSEPDKIYTDDMTSSSPQNISLINSFTYQLISTPGENLLFIEEAAIKEWTESLFFSGTVPSQQEAIERIEILKKNNPQKYKSEIAKYYKKAKQKYLVDPEFDGTQLLHANAKKLIDDMVAAKVKIVIMDESHHLLDYWALILKELLKRLDNPILIGLTATPPIDVEEEHLENYLALLGDVDFEIPTPAVVKEGNLAPYQDLVYFTFPTDVERNFIKTIQESFEAFIDKLTTNQKFAAWHGLRFFQRIGKTGEKLDWEIFFREHVALSIAGIKYALKKNIALPYDIPVIEEMEKDINFEDWTVLISDYISNYLLISSDPTDHQEVKDMAGQLKAFGMSVTDSGVRIIRSPADRILSLSESKNGGAIKILTTEMGSMGRNIRAVVITDFEQESALVTKALEGTLPKGAGSALRTFETIAEDPTTMKLDPILVTGTRVLIEISEAATIIPAMEEWQTAKGLTFTITTKQTENPAIIEVVGQGKDWKSSTYVRMVTHLFEAGVTKCLVGTRGLLAEGWDTLGLNTLIDLTTATTSMMVQQIRGRSLRIDPTTPRKLANNWDVVCVETHFEKGDQDFKRLTKKHSRFYGLTNTGEVMKGLGHVDMQLYFLLSELGFKKLNYQLLNNHMLSKSTNRSSVYDKWNIGQEYQNFEFSMIKLAPGTIKFKTAFSLKESLGALFRSITGLAVTIVFQYLFFFHDFLGVVQENNYLMLIFVGILSVLILFATGKQIIKYIRLAFIELPIDSFILDIGKCVLKSLREAGFVEGSLSIDNVRVTITPEGYYDLFLDYANSKDTNTFTQAVKQCLSTVSDQRYIISRSEADIKIGFFSPFWWILRNTYAQFFEQQELAYHPVPNILSTHRKYAEIFAKNWNEYVGGSHLIYTRSEKGLEILLNLRKKRNTRIRRMEMNYWK